MSVLFVYKTQQLQILCVNILLYITKLSFFCFPAEFPCIDYILKFYVNMCFQVDDEDLQDEPLQITVLDHDTYSANDAIGKVYIDIDPLLYSEAATVISGWFPIYDTIHGKTY